MQGSLGNFAMMDNVASIRTDEELQEMVLDSDRPAVVIFGTEWCEDTQAIAPDLSELADEYEDRVDFFKIDTEMSPEMRDRYEVEVTPTVMMFFNGRVLDTWVNEQDPWVYRRGLNAILSEQGRRR